MINNNNDYYNNNNDINNLTNDINNDDDLFPEQEYLDNCYLFEVGNTLYTIPNFNTAPENLIVACIGSSSSKNEDGNLLIENIPITTTDCSFFKYDLSIGDSVFENMYFITERKVVVIVPIHFSCFSATDRTRKIGDMIILLSEGKNNMECLRIKNIKNVVKDYLPLKDGKDRYKSGNFYLEFNGQLRRIETKQSNYSNNASLKDLTWIVHNFDDNPSTNYNHGSKTTHPTAIFLNFKPANQTDLN